MQYVTAYYIDARDGRPASEAPLRHGPMKPSDNLEIDAVDRRQDPPLIIGRIPADEPLASGMTQISEGEHAAQLADYQVWRDDVARRELAKRRAAMIVTPRQARLALLQAGLLSQVDDALSSLDAPEREVAQIEWEYATTVERGSQWIANLGSALGLSELEIDELFITASAL